MSEEKEKRRAGLEALEKFTEENSIGKQFGRSLASPFGRGIGSVNRGSFTRSDIERYRLDEGSIGFDDDFSFMPRPTPPKTSQAAVWKESVQPDNTVPAPADRIVPAEPIPSAENAARETPEISDVRYDDPTVSSAYGTETVSAAEERISAELHDSWNISPVQAEVIVNHSRECFSILRAKNSSGRAGYEEISKGFIDISEVRTIVGYDGTKRVYLSARFRRDHISEEGLISREMLENEPEKLYDTAALHNVRFTSRKNAGLSAKYLLSVSEEKDNGKTCYLSFHRDETGKMRHPDEAMIFRNTASGDEVKEFFLKEADMQTVFLLGCRLMTELEAVGYMNEFPPLLLTAAEPDTALAALSEILGISAFYRVDKHYRQADDERIRLYNAASGTKYNIGKYFSCIIESSLRKPTIFVTDRENLSAYGSVAAKAVRLPYEAAEYDMRRLGRIYDFMRSAFLKNCISPEEWQQIADGIDVSEFNVYVSYLAAQILLSVWLVLSEVMVKEQAEEFLGMLRRWILSVTEDPDARMVSNLKDFLRSGADGVSLNRSGNVHVTVEALNGLARRGIWQNDFASSLSSMGILQRGDLSFQRTATVNGRSRRVYEIVQDKLFTFGELRTVVNEFAKCCPDIVIPFAECDGKTISLAFSDIAQENPTVRLSGTDIALRRSVCSAIICGARKQGIEVIGAEISDTEDTVSDDGVTYRHFIDANAGNGYLAGLLNDRKRSEKPPVLLMIEDAAKWDTSARSPLSKILRSGGKYGIICCVTDSRADTDSEYAVYIHTGEFGFRPAERRIFGIPAGECPEKQAVLEMTENSFLAVGTLASEKGYIRGTVIAKTCK